jgi:Uma2 family endonuclease
LIVKRRHAYTYGDYLMLEADAPTVRHEFVDGEILAMAGGSALHSALIAAVNGELYRQLEGRRAVSTTRTCASTSDRPGTRSTRTRSWCAGRPTSCTRSGAAPRS